MWLPHFHFQVSEQSENHAKELEDIESANNKKLMSEYEKYQELQTKSQRMQEDYERQLQQMEEAKEHALEELTEYYEKKLQGMHKLLSFNGSLAFWYFHINTSLCLSDRPFLRSWLSFNSRWKT